MVSGFEAVTKWEGQVILFYKEFLSGYARCPFSGFFIGDLYRFPMELKSPANGCGFLRPLK
jgi:hypothetical protein